MQKNIALRSSTGIMSSALTHGLPFAIIDAAIISVTGLVCTLAVIFWIVIIVLRRIGRKHMSSNVSDDDYVMLKGSRNSLSTQAAKKIDRWFNIDKNIHLFVRYYLPVFESESIESDGRTILLNHVPTIFMEQLLLFSFVVLALSTQAFVSNYLFIKSYGCTTERYVHCFKGKVHFLTVEDEQLDCTNGTAIKDITSIICYDLTLNVTRAISEAGATIAGAAVYFAVITWVLLKLLNKLCCRCCLVFTQVSITTIASVVVLARKVALILDEDTVYEDFVSIIVNMYVVLLGGMIPWWKFKLHHRDYIV